MKKVSILVISLFLLIGCSKPKSIEDQLIAIRNSHTEALKACNYDEFTASFSKYALSMMPPKEQWVSDCESGSFAAELEGYKLSYKLYDANPLKSGFFVLVENATDNEGMPDVVAFYIFVQEGDSFLFDGYAASESQLSDFF